MSKERSSGMCGRPDATGRSSGKLAGRDRRTYAPPKGEPWVWQTSELLSSPAWRSMSVNTRRLIDFLMVEHRAHAGKENGNLRAPYDQLVAWGLPRSEIRAAVLEAEALGLLRYERGGRWAGSNKPSTYRLSFYADKDGNPPTNDWKGKTEEAIALWRHDRSLQNRQKRERQKQIPSSTSRTTVVRLSELPNRTKRRGR